MQFTHRHPISVCLPVCFSVLHTHTLSHSRLPSRQKRGNSHIWINKTEIFYSTISKILCLLLHLRVEHRGLSTLVKELTATTHKMQTFSNELSTLVSGKAKCKQNESYYMMPDNSRADVCHLVAEQYDTKSNVKLSGFRSQLQASLGACGGVMVSKLD